jgi:heme exporter protein A
MTSAISITHLNKTYASGFQALKHINLEIRQGEIFALLGPNGAGKTTLLRILATLLRPHAGTARILGNNLPEAAWAVRGRLGLLGHEPLLYRELSARENLRFHARLHGATEERVDELLDAVGMAGRTHEPVRTLSRGMTQRVAVARAVLHDPELLLLDEPRANLDPAGVELIEPLITRRADRNPASAPTSGRRTRVLCSHDPDADIAGADLVLGLRAGRQALLATPSRLTDREIGELYQ